jgi:TM2 domain-containing membrane protein YozV
METTDQNPTNFNTPPEKPPVENKKMAAGLCALLCGGFGVHKFILGYNLEGGIMLGVTLSGIALSFCLVGLIWVWIPGTIALIEGIMYLTKTDEEFYETYQKNKRGWF